METITIESRGGKHGKEVISYLERLGGKNTYSYRGAAIGFYYYINSKNEIDCMLGLSYIPNAKLVELPEEKQYPKVMMVSDDPITAENKGEQRVVFMEKNGKYLTWYKARTLERAEKETATIAWIYAVDIPEETKEKVQLLETTEGLLKKISELEKEITEFKKQLK